MGCDAQLAAQDFLAGKCPGRFLGKSRGFVCRGNFLGGGNFLLWNIQGNDWGLSGVRVQISPYRMTGFFM